eukprot:1390060-Pyramimonas_sp.AAC.1
MATSHMDNAVCVDEDGDHYGSPAPAASTRSRTTSRNAGPMTTTSSATATRGTTSATRRSLRRSTLASFTRPMRPSTTRMRCKFGSGDCGVKVRQVGPVGSPVNGSAEEEALSG